jgi:Ni/Co efflux regulator RcnB
MSAGKNWGQVVRLGMKRKERTGYLVLGCAVIPSHPPKEPIMSLRTLTCTAAAFALLGAPAAFAQQMDHSGPPGQGGGQYAYQSGGHIKGSGGQWSGDHTGSGQPSMGSGSTSGTPNMDHGQPPAATPPMQPQAPSGGPAAATPPAAGPTNAFPAQASHDHAMGAMPPSTAAAPQGPHLARGLYMPENYRNGVYRVGDWRGNHLHKPKSGYRWIRVDGHFYLIKEKSGMIVEAPG